ncbi:MAG TPA: NAD(P)H-hydrate dehydratase [Candidatus Binataceae bacterium]|jgi:NAD(P)H-hydrate epimerase|nr:NAD(P)H-hydrate dehydratase [Candidatus Binataceae bacterium]
MILLNAAESRELDRLSQEKYGIASYELMRRAGEAVADLLLRRWPGAIGGSILVVAGKGNNGGDGLVAARKLKQVGAQVQVILLAPAAELKGDAARAHRDYLAAGGSLDEVTSAGAIDAAIRREKRTAVVDAIFGIGLNAEIRGVARGAIDAINSLGVPVIAIDIASGINADTGVVMGAAVSADQTVTFGFAKYGHVSYPGAEFTGELEIADIGFAAAAIGEIAPRGRLVEAGETKAMIGTRALNSHKGTYGHPLIIAGSRGKSGAAILAARGALRMGAGLVTAAIPESICAIVANGQPELMTVPMRDRDGRFAVPAAIDQLKTVVGDMNALVAGPGIGVSEDTRTLVAWLVEEGAQAHRPLLIDADGLNVVAAMGAPLLKSAQGPIVLTPHPGEMARLLGISTTAVNADRIAASRRLVDLTGADVLLKGARTVIAGRDGRVSINSSGNPGMATPGMGDVLSGMIGALLAQGRSPEEALVLAAFIHGYAADRLAERIGPVGYLAGDLAAELPAAMASLSA